MPLWSTWEYYPKTHGSFFCVTSNVLCFVWETQQMCHRFVFNALSVFIAGLYQGWALLPQKCDINRVLVSRKEVLSVLSFHPHGADETWWTTSMGPLWDVQRWALLVFELWVSDGKKDLGWTDVRSDCWGQCWKETCLLCLSLSLSSHIFHKMGILG